MTNKEPLANASKIISRLVIAHMLLIVGNAFAHEKLGTFYFVVDHLPILFIFTFIPVIAAFMIEKEKTRQGNMILQGAMGAALFYNFYDHFFTMPIPVIHPVPLLWNILCEGSFGALLIVEILIMCYGMKIFRDVHADEIQKGNNSSSVKNDA